MEQPGAYAEFAVVAASTLVPIPDGVETRTAAAVMLQGMTAHYLAVSTYPLKQGETALVHAAAGGVGLLLVQIAKRQDEIRDRPGCLRQSEAQFFNACFK